MTNKRRVDLQALTPTNWSFLQKSLQKKAIIHLETRYKKMLIPILLIEELGFSLKTKKKFLAVFMAPTVHLVKQPTCILHINLDLRVDNFHGAKGVDYWSKAMWKEQVKGPYGFSLGCLPRLCKVGELPSSSKAVSTC